MAVAVGAGFWMARGETDTIAYHNRAIEQAMANPVSVTIATKEWLNIDCERKSVRITDPDRVRWVLKRFRLPTDTVDEKSIHKCGGHLDVTVQSRSAIHQFSYDHGQGIYPIRGEVFAGFIDLEHRASDELNQYLLSIGFSRGQIGLYVELPQAPTGAGEAGSKAQ